MDVGSLTSLSDRVVLLGGVSHVVRIGLWGLDLRLAGIIGIKGFVDVLSDFLVFVLVDLSRFTGFTRVGGFLLLVSITIGGNSVLEGNG